jgi:hypothetical protein
MEQRVPETPKRRGLGAVRSSYAGEGISELKALDRDGWELRVHS